MTKYGVAPSSEYPNRFEALVQDRNSKIPLIEEIKGNVDTIKTMVGKPLFNANTDQSVVASDPVYQKLDEAYSFLNAYKRGNFEFVHGGELDDICHADLNIGHLMSAIEKRSMDEDTYDALSHMSPVEIMMDAGSYISAERADELALQSTAMDLALLGKTWDMKGFAEPGS